MQFPVPQFTDVEDKIIGSLTVKQFGIIFGVGAIIFLGFSATKSLAVTVVLFLVVGLPGLGLALVPFNGRPMYSSIGKLIKFITVPKVYVFHREVQNFYKPRLEELKSKKEEEKGNGLNKEEPEERLKKLEMLLAKTAKEERETAGKIHLP